MRTADQIVQAQLDAHNAKDIDALLATYHPEAEHYVLHGELLARGHAAMRSRFLNRFNEPNLRAELITRSVMNNFVIDHERVTRTFPERAGHIEMLCVYQVVDGLIVEASFAVGLPQIGSSAGAAT